MVPMLAVSACVSGMLFVNGRFAAEIDEEIPWLGAVNPSGTAYLMFMPLEADYLPLCRKLEIVRGEAVLSETQNMYVVAWAGGVAEVELRPERRACKTRPIPNAQGYSYSVGQIICPSGKILRIPDACEMPQAQGESILWLTGRTENREYIAAIEGETLLGYVEADSIARNGDSFSALVKEHDVLGHARKELWKTDNALVLAEKEAVWEDGTPHVPQTPEEKARVVMESAFAHREEDMLRYCTPYAAEQARRFAEEYDLCVSMQYPPQDAKPCVALLKRVGERCAKATALYFRISANADVIEEFSV